MRVDCAIYIACPMSGRDKLEIVDRAIYLCSIARQYGLTPISPVIEEHVIAAKGPLLQDSVDTLAGFWKRDKDIIRNRDGKGAHVVLIDAANLKSFGCEREYGLNRYCLWKPTVLLMPTSGINVSRFEDDYVTANERLAFTFIRDNFGTWFKRVKWRVKMLVKALPGWILDQIVAWR